MNLKSKLAYMALGGVLVLVGHVLPGLVVGSATAQGGLQDAEFNEVTVRKLTVVDEATGATVARMFGLADGGGAIGVYHPDGTTAVGITVDSDGGLITVRQPDGSTAASMEVSPQGGGMMIVMDPEGSTAAGMMSLVKDGEAVGGLIEVYAPPGWDSELRAPVRLTVDKYGGRVSVYAKGGGSSRAGLAVNEYGNGAVSTWDKNGYRQ